MLSLSFDDLTPCLFYEQVWKTINGISIGWDLILGKQKSNMRFELNWAWQLKSTFTWRLDLHVQWLH